jgi:hypothetical protein
MRAGGRLFALAVPVLAACGAAPPPETKAAAATVTLCADGEFRRNLEARIDGPVLELSAECDTGSAVPVRRIPVALPAASAAGALSMPRQAILQPMEEGAPHRFELQTGRTRCRPVLATPTGEPPIPSRFTDRYGRWTLSVGFLADPGCRVLIVFAGNRAAVLTPGTGARASLYDLALALGDS